MYNNFFSQYYTMRFLVSSSPIHTIYKNFKLATMLQCYMYEFTKLQLKKLTHPLQKGPIKFQWHEPMGPYLIIPRNIPGLMTHLPPLKDTRSGHLIPAGVGMAGSTRVVYPPFDNTAVRALLTPSCRFYMVVVTPTAHL